MESPYGVSQSHSDTPHSVGLLWTSDQLVTQTFIWQHTTLSSARHTDLYLTTHNTLISPSHRPIPAQHTTLSSARHTDLYLHNTQHSHQPLTQTSILQHTTLSSARHTDLYLTTHNSHNRQTDRHLLSGIRNRNLIIRAAADLRLRQGGHWDRPVILHLAEDINLIPVLY
jgi:hypothetical protein